MNRKVGNKEALILFQGDNLADVKVDISRTAEFYAVAQRLSEYIHSLPIDKAQNDELVALMVDQVKVAELGGFLFGLQLGMDLKAAIGREGVRQ